MSDTIHRFTATAPRGLADLLARELCALGASNVTESGTSVHFEGQLGVGYRACLWSRIASRVLLQLAELQAEDEPAFYAQARAVDWAAHVDPAGTLACEFNGVHPAITHSHFGALRLKDAVCDRLREQTGTRPSIQLNRPAVRIVAHANGPRLQLSLDLAGESLHRRGYRVQAGEAPLRENLAAGVLLRARWDEAAARGLEFLDPMCGAGTLVIEAAMIAGQRAPGLLRSYFGFLGWRQHDPLLWEELCVQARAGERAAVGGCIRGRDLDERVLLVARANAARARVTDLLHLEHGALEDARPSGTQPGLLCTNPPYGERLGSAPQALAVHAALGRVLREHFVGWDAAILTAAAGAAGALRLRSYRAHQLWNGAMACRLLRIDLAAPGSPDLQTLQAERAAKATDSPGARMFANRLEKNLRRLARRARESAVSCYRLYDADMPEYAFAIDRYEQLDGGLVHLLVHEYAAPANIDPQACRRRRQEVLATLPHTLAVPPERIHLRLRQRQRGASQYQPRRVGQRSAELAAGAGALAVAEGGLRFLVNLDDYLDCGLFLDHRLTRALLRERAAGARFLNLFCYTASASVYAAAGGARETVSIDLSNRYLEWAAENFRINGMAPERHTLVRADCLAWLRDASGGRFDLIFLDPPTFSNSKRMQGVLDIQRDHVELIEACVRRLTPGGALLFSTNAQRFRLDERLTESLQITDLSRVTLPFDFERHPRIHRCYLMRPRTGASAGPGGVS